MANPVGELERRVVNDRILQEELKRLSSVAVNAGTSCGVEAVRSSINLGVDRCIEAGATLVKSKISVSMPSQAPIINPAVDFAKVSLAQKTKEYSLDLVDTGAEPTRDSIDRIARQQIDSCFG